MFKNKNKFKQRKALGPNIITKESLERTLTQETVMNTLEELRTTYKEQTDDAELGYKNSLKKKLATMMLKGQLMAIFMIILTATFFFAAQYSNERQKI